jgi:hypothetical protein
MENREAKIEALLALKNDKSVKSWIGPNHVLFKDSGDHRDMFLTTYRIRNAYEELLTKLEVNDEVTEDRDIVDEESQAWLMGYLAQETYKFIAKNSFKIIK